MQKRLDFDAQPQRITRSRPWRNYRETNQLCDYVPGMAAAAPEQCGDVAQV
jgi:hypothetical protein